MMMQTTRLLRAAIEASIEASRVAVRDGEHFADGEPYVRAADAREAADKAWEEYDTYVWAQDN